MSCHRNATRKKTKTEIPITFKVNVTEVGSVLRTKEEKYKESFQNLQENVLQHVLENDKKGGDLALLIRKPGDVEISSKEL